MAPMVQCWRTGRCPDETEPDVPPDRWWPVAGSAVDGGQPTLSWAEPITQTNWNLVVTDGATGRELLRTDLGEVGEVPVHADFDGRFWVGTFADTQDPASGEWQPARVVVVDTAAAPPAAIEIACPAGTIATIDRLGVAAPVATVDNDDTVDHDNGWLVARSTSRPSRTYPIQRCDRAGSSTSRK